MSKQNKRPQTKEKTPERVWTEIYVLYKWLDELSDDISVDNSNMMKQIEKRIKHLTQQLRCLSDTKPLSSNNEE